MNHGPVALGNFLHTHGNAQFLKNRIGGYRSKSEARQKKISRIENLLQNKLQQIEGLISHLEGLPDEQEQHRHYQKIGELILAQISNITPGKKKVKITDLYDPDQKMIQVSLNPHLTASENATQFFEKARKVAENTRQVRENIKQLLEQKKKLTGLTHQLCKDSDWQTIHRIEKQRPTQGKQQA